jgi:hypothetical protein
MHRSDSVPTSAPRTPSKIPVTRATATSGRHPEMAGQGGDPSGGGRHNRSHRPRPWPFPPRPWAGPPPSVVRTAPGTRRPRTHSGRRRPGFAPRSAFALVSGGRLGRSERAVKPSAQPTMVRTHHLPPPAETAR